MKGIDPTDLLFKKKVGKISILVISTGKNKGLHQRQFGIIGLSGLWKNMGVPNLICVPWAQLHIWFISKTVQGNKTTPLW